MKTLWDRQIAPVDRAVGPLEWRSVRARILKLAVRKRRGLPSRSVSTDAMFELLTIKAAKRRGEPPDVRRVVKLEWLLLRDRLLERKRAVRQATRRRTRPSVNDSKINLWRRRRDWLRSASAGQRA